MNIFAKIIITTDTNIKNAIIERLSLKQKEIINDLEIFIKTTEDENIVLIFSPNKDFEKVIHYAKDNYEIIKILNVWNSIALWDLDMISWDVIIPNTIINEKNEAVFFDSLIEKNYDLKKFGLILNGICFSKENEFKDKEGVLDLHKEYIGEILDDEAFLFAKELEKNHFISLSVIIKIISKEVEYIENGVDILELMI